MSTEGMAKVLGEHRWVDFYPGKCACEWRTDKHEVTVQSDHDAHVADALAAAGHGSLADSANYSLGYRSAVATLDSRAEKAEAALAELNGAISWGTTCLNCAKVLDSCYAETVRAEKAVAERDAALEGQLRAIHGSPDKSLMKQMMDATDYELAVLRDGIEALADELGEPDSWNSLSEDSFPHVINRLRALLAEDGAKPSRMPPGDDPRAGHEIRPLL